MICLAGRILGIDGFEKGYVIIKGRKIHEVGKIPALKPDYKGYIIPSPINAHTHLGDAFIKKKLRRLPRDLEKLVAPPKGIKHLLLGRADRSEIINGIREKLMEMEGLGLAAFCDFREGGIEGINILKEAMKGFEIGSVILSRPRSLTLNKREVEDLLKTSDGIGLSSLSDWNYDDARKIAEITRRRKKVFAMHASEGIREDIDEILDLKPSFLVHLTKATEGDLERVRVENVPVVVCPRSNQFFGLRPNLELMKKTGIEISVGTDNAMISDPDIYKEIRWIRRNVKVFDLEEILRMITYNPRRMLGIKMEEMEEGKDADLVVLDTKSLKPLFISGREVSQDEG